VPNSKGRGGTRRERGEGERESKGRGGEGRGKEERRGREFVLCPKKKKRKVGVYVRHHSNLSVSALVARSA